MFDSPLAGAHSTPGRRRLAIMQASLHQRSQKIIRNESPRYKWYILSLSMLAYCILGGVERMCLPVLFNEISADLGLSLVSIGTIWGLDPLAGFLSVCREDCWLIVSDLKTP